MSISSLRAVFDYNWLAGVPPGIGVGSLWRIATERIGRICVEYLHR